MFGPGLTDFGVKLTIPQTGRPSWKPLTCVMCRLTSGKENEEVLTLGQQGSVPICTPSIKSLPDHRTHSKLCAYQNKVKMMSLNLICHEKLSQNHEIAVVRAVRKKMLNGPVI